MEYTELSHSNWPSFNNETIKLHKTVFFLLFVLQNIQQYVATPHIPGIWNQNKKKIM